MKEDYKWTLFDMPRLNALETLTVDTTDLLTIDNMVAENVTVVKNKQT